MAGTKGPLKTIMISLVTVYALRSDGVLFTVGPDGVREENCPTAEQMQRTQVKNEPDKVQYYKLLTPEDEKHRDWRMKLAGMMIKEIGTEVEKAAAILTPYVLAEFPENFQLFEHIKTSADGTKPGSSSKAHAGGGNDRQDAYLYGHPGGRRKRYRSPGEFLPHLVWLLNTSSFDSDDCRCRLCSPDELQRTRRNTSAAQGATKTGRANSTTLVSSTTSPETPVLPVVSKTTAAPPASQYQELAPAQSFVPLPYSAIPPVNYGSSHQQSAPTYAIYQQPHSYPSLSPYQQQLPYPNQASMGYHQQQPQAIQSHRMYQQPHGSESPSQLQAQQDAHLQAQQDAHLQAQQDAHLQAQQDAHLQAQRVTYQNHEAPDGIVDYDLNGFSGQWKQD